MPGVRFKTLSDAIANIRRFDRSNVAPHHFRSLT